MESIQNLAAEIQRRIDKKSAIKNMKVVMMLEASFCAGFLRHIIIKLLEAIMNFNVYEVWKNA